jgi:hypothetical protein
LLRFSDIPKGTLLLIDDFIEEYDYETARQILQRLTNGGQLMRLNRGIYYIPKKDDLLGIIKPSADQIVLKIINDLKHKQLAMPILE